MKKLFLLLVLAISLPIFMVGCTKSQASLTAELDPTIRVYNTSLKTTSEMPIEDYVAGVVAGEVYNSWNEEALKTQCILARTFALKYASDNPEIYKEKGISTNIADAQSYDESTINEAIKAACEATRGQILTYNDQIIDAYFHSNSGGKTAFASEGFLTDQNPEYIKSVSSPETSLNSKNYSWRYEFSKSEVLTALDKLGISLSNISSASLGEKSENGFYKNVVIGGKTINAIKLRTALGTTKMRSIKLTKFTISGDNLVVEGLGYGHGVGVSQWGAKILADQGKTYKEILDYYYNNVEIKTLY